MSTYKPSPLRNEDRNAQILKAVESGMSYDKAAEELGTTRNVVSGVCRRAGLKTGLRVGPEAVSQRFRRYFASLTPDQRKAHTAPGCRARIRYLKARALRAGELEGA